MSNRSKHVIVKTDKNNISLKFDSMFSVKATRREMPPPTKVEPAKKGKGSTYNRKEKHKKGYQSGDDDGISFLWTGGNR